MSLNGDSASLPSMGFMSLSYQYKPMSSIYFTQKQAKIPWILACFCRFSVYLTFFLTAADQAEYTFVPFAVL